MPRIAAFPKAFLDALCMDGSMSLDAWIEQAATLGIDGLEMYAGMLDLQDAGRWNAYRRQVEAAGMTIPMLCCSPDFTHPDPAFRAEQVEREKGWITMTAKLGGRYCRVLSGQRRPEVTRKEGLRYAADGIRACLAFAAQHGITLVLENHYKDAYWEHPEFAQHADVFCELVAAIDTATYPNFGVNYDPSNTLLAGEDPIALLRRIKHRVVTMHASDRYLAEGTIDDLRQEEDSVGYAKRLHHGEIGRGMNDYDAIFAELVSVGFDGWISIEDGMEGLDQLRRSVDFLRRKIAQYWRSA